MLAIAIDLTGETVVLGVIGGWVALLLFVVRLAWNQAKIVAQYDHLKSLYEHNIPDLWKAVDDLRKAEKKEEGEAR
jgi:hypothetical protein